MTDSQLQSSKLTSGDTQSIIKHLEQAITGGKHWYLALLEAIGLWAKSEETYNGRTYRYLIAGEAFDWLLLAERLCQEIGNLLPDGEKTDFLFYGRPPLNLTVKEFKQLVGAAKYHQYLTYLYGVTVEKALILTVQKEVRKERQIWGENNEHDTTDEAYNRIYGATKATLLKRFRKEKGYPQLRSISLAGLNEFTYWLFKYRLKHCEKAKVASDTKKALDQMESHLPTIYLRDHSMS